MVAICEIVLVISGHIICVYIHGHHPQDLSILFYFDICTVYNDYVSYNTHLGCLQASIFARFPCLMMHEAIHIVHLRDIFHPTEVARYSSMIPWWNTFHHDSPLALPKESHLTCFFGWITSMSTCVPSKRIMQLESLSLPGFAVGKVWNTHVTWTYKKNIQAISLMIVHILNTRPESHKGNEQWNIYGFQRYLQYCS